MMQEDMPLWSILPEYKYKREFESCILCKKLLDIPKIQSITCRQFYIEGAGQLCEECYRDLYENHECKE